MMRNKTAGSSGIQCSGGARRGKGADGARVQLYEQTKGHCIPGSGWQAARTQAALKT